MGGIGGMKGGIPPSPGGFMATGDLSLLTSLVLTKTYSLTLSNISPLKLKGMSSSSIRVCTSNSSINGLITGSRFKQLSILTFTPPTTLLTLDNLLLLTLLSNLTWVFGIVFYLAFHHGSFNPHMTKQNSSHPHFFNVIACFDVI